MDWLLPPCPVRVSIVHTARTPNLELHTLYSAIIVTQAVTRGRPSMALPCRQIRIFPPFFFLIRNFQLPIEYVQGTITTYYELELSLLIRMAHHGSRGVCLPPSSGGTLQFNEMGLLKVICTIHHFSHSLPLSPSLLVLLSRQAF